MKVSSEQNMITFGIKMGSDSSLPAINLIDGKEVNAMTNLDELVELPIRRPVFVVEISLKKLSIQPLSWILI
jgi:hypothetical protein